MKTIRTIIATLSVVLLTYALVAWFSVRRSAAFIQRTIYQGFDQTFVVALVMGSAFLLIAVILTVAIFSTDEDDEEDEERYRPRPRTRPIPREEQAYRRVSRDRTQDQGRPARREDSNFVRPRTRAEETPKPRKRMADRTEELAFREEEAPVKREKRAPKPAPKPVPEPEEEFEEVLEPVAEAPAAEPEEAEEVREPVSEAEPQAAPDEASEPAKEEDTVRCVYCGSVISRDSLFCPRCGKKR
jgi:hypothetical protein